MTTEKRFVVRFTDIKAIRLECKRCHATIGLPPDNWKQATIEMLSCKNCGHEWMKPMGASEKALAKMSDAIRDLIRDADGLGFELQLEFDGPEES